MTGNKRGGATSKRDDGGSRQHVSKPADYDPNEDLLKMEIPPVPAPVMSADGTGARLVMSHIDVNNFKSYFGRQTIGPFHKNFTAVIGPNGSGKSNVIDALLFVFGYRAAKVRTKKVSCLIHSSTDHDNVLNCTVTVHFQKIIETEDGRVRIAEGSRMSISRMVNQEGTSRYSLNGRTCLFRDITRELLTAGIDIVHNRFLILQGEVEMISQMKPKAKNDGEDGMLEYLEDLIGSSRLKPLIDKLAYKLDQINEKLSMQLVRVKHAEKEKTDLEGPVKDVITQLQIDNGIALATNKIACINRLASQKQVEELEPERERLADELENAKSGMAEINKRSKKLKSEKEEIHNDLGKKQEALAAASTDLREHKQKATKATNDIKRHRSQLKKTKSELKAAEERIVELEELPEKAANHVEELKAEIEQATKVIESNTPIIEEKLAEVGQQTASLIETKKKRESELGKHVSAEDELASQLALAQEELRNLERDEEAEKSKFTDLMMRLGELKQELETKSRNALAAQERMPKVEQELIKVKGELASYQKKQAELVERIRDTRVQIEEVRQSLEGQTGASRLLDALMIEQDTGRIPGIYGRLGNLGAIDALYDVAISTTCGPLDNIVVDSVNTAQLCIQFLKRENLGTATFIALDKQQPLIPYMHNHPVTPENAPRLFDLIRVEDESVLPAFYYALADTLVADDIATATRIAMGTEQRWRTVTLKGEIVEASGAMTGGGDSQRSGRIGRSIKPHSIVTPEDLAKLNTTLQDDEAKLRETRQNMATVEVEHDQKQSEFNRLEKFLSDTTKAEIKSLQDGLDAINKHIEAQQKKLDSFTDNSEAVGAANTKIEGIEKDSKKLSVEGNALRKELTELDQQIERINEQIVGRYQKLLRQAKETKELAEKQIAKEQSAISSNDRNLAKARARCKELEQDLEQTKTDKEKAEKRKSEAEKKIAELEELVETRKKEVTKAQEAYKRSAEGEKQLNAEELEMQKRLKDTQERSKVIERKVAKLRSNIKSLNDQISKLKLFHFDCLAHLPRQVLKEPSDDMDLNESVLNELSFVDDMNGRQSPMTPEEEEFKMEVASDSSKDDNDDDGEPELFNAPVPVKQKRKPEPKPSGTVRYKRKVPRYDVDVIRNFDLDKLKEQLAKLEKRKQSRKKEVNIGIVLDYIERVKRFNTESDALQKVTHDRDVHREFCERLRKQRLQEFMEGYRSISEHLKEMYQMITLGGDASLDLVNSLDPFSDGISFGVRPPKKSWKQISNLSGGEKTLASLALIFGLHHYRPAPLYVMDEIDAALDYRNVSIVSHLIKERTKNAQFIIISLRNNMFERSDRLVGIYKVNDCTQHLVVDNNIRKLLAPA